MNIKLFLTIKACYKLPYDVTEKIWSIVKTEAKKTIQERIQDMYHRKIEIVRQLFLRLDTLSKNNGYTELNYVYKSILSYAKISNYMYMQVASKATNVYGFFIGIFFTLINISLNIYIFLLWNSNYWLEISNFYNAFFLWDLTIFNFTFV